MKKQEMITQMNNRFSNMNEASVEALFNIIMLIPDQKSWMAFESQKADQQAEAKRNQLYKDFSKMFDAINTVDIPLRYDIGIEEIKAIDFVCGGIIKCFPEYALSVANNYFSYGFANGMKYAKTQARKKAKKEDR